MNKRKFLSYFPALAGLMGGGVVAGKAVADERILKVEINSAQIMAKLKPVQERIAEVVAENEELKLAAIEYERRIEALKHGLDINHEYVIKLEEKLRIGYPQG